MLQGYDSIRELLLAKVPAAARPLVRFIVGCRVRPSIRSALHHQVRHQTHHPLIQSPRYRGSPLTAAHPASRMGPCRLLWAQ